MPSPVRRSARAAPPSISHSSSAPLTTSRPQSTPVPPVQTSETPSSEEMNDAPRRSKRAHLPPELDVKNLEIEEEAIGDDEEITRCICRHQEYPGPPLSEAFTAIDTQSDDAGGLFIQCDGCSVWQHGGCVGIVDESQSPDKYFCELCRPKQHEVHTDVRGQRYSLYLPVTSRLVRRKSSISKGSDDRGKRDRADTASRASADPATGKRRGTIRSREHDEEAEQIQRAIEESTKEIQGKRNGKRSREESSDDLKQELKRQRRASESTSHFGRTASLDYDSDDDPDNPSASRAKKVRAEANQTARQAEQRDRDRERERTRAEAAGRRQERAGRRRGDDFDAKDSNGATRSGSQSPPNSSRANSPASFAAPDKPLGKKAPGKKFKKLGNNQYTKSRADSAAASSPHGRKRLLQSGGTSSGDEQAPGSDGPAASGTPSAHEGPASTGIGRGRWGKSKRGGLHANGGRNITSEPMERTIPNMARNLDGMMAFIHRAQLDVADDQARVVGVPQQSSGSGLSNEILLDGKSAMDLADQLTRGIRDWQERFASSQEGVRA